MREFSPIWRCLNGWEFPAFGLRPGGIDGFDLGISDLKNAKTRFGRGGDLAPVGGNEKVGPPLEGTGHVQGVHREIRELTDNSLILVIFLTSFPPEEPILES